MRTLVIALVAALAAGCSSTPRPGGERPLAGSRTAEPAPALRERVEAYAGRFSATIDETAGQLIERAGDRDARRAAMTWALRADEESQRCLQGGPGGGGWTGGWTGAGGGDAPAALLDLWVLATQLRAYADSPAAEAAFGDSRPIVLAAALDLETDVHRLADESSGAVAGAAAHALVERWTAENPLRADWSRPSMRTFWSRYRKEVDPTIVLAGRESWAPAARISTRQLDWRAALALEERLGAIGAPAGLPAPAGADAPAAATEADRLLESAMGRLETLVTDALNAFDQRRNASMDEMGAIVASAVSEISSRDRHLADVIFWRTAALLATGLAAALAMILLTTRRRRGSASGAAAILRPSGRTLTAGHA